MCTQQGPPGYWERHGGTGLCATWEDQARRAVATLDIARGVVAGLDVGEVHRTEESE
jgi:hypothetical protein